MTSIKITVTGGPSGGKTTLLESLKREFAKDIAIVPEAASILYRGGFPRGATPEARVCVQLAIFHTQLNLEEFVRHTRASPLMICDRGSLDSIAYWPFPEDHFYKSIGSSQDRELQRYDWVIHLDTAPMTDYDETNPIRTESFAEAMTLNDRVKEAWRKHPRRVIIPGQTDFLTKMTLATTVVQSIQLGESVEKIQQLIAASTKGAR